MAKRARGSAPDRLSALPDELLCRVLSFLPSRQAVQTSVLSKKWMDLWRSVPAISIRTSDFGGGLDADGPWWTKMQDFTTNLLMLHKAPCLDAFRLHLSFADGHPDPWSQVLGLIPARDAERWVRRGIKYQPLELEIRVDLNRFAPYSFQIPRLGSEFHRLKRLEFHGVFFDRCFMERLSSGCPALEDLVLHFCSNDFAIIQSNTLKSLVVRACTSRVADRLVVRAPCLAYISLCFIYYNYENGLSLEAGNSLVTASICVPPEGFSPRTEAILLGSVFNATSLELKCFQAMAILDNGFYKFPIFDNLRTLSLIWCFRSERDADKFKALGRFLHKSPNLEELILKQFWVRPVVGPIEFPMLENLRTLFLDECELHDNFRILRHLLRRSPNLEKLTVRSCELPKVSNGKERKRQAEEDIFWVSEPCALPM